MKYVIDVPEDRISAGRLRVLADMENSMTYWIETGIRVTPYEEPSDTVDDVWKMVSHILKSPDAGGMSWDDIEDCFGTNSISGIAEMPYAEAREKYDAWKKRKRKNEINVGDEVNVDDYKGVVTWVNETHAEGFCIFETHLIRFYRLIGNLVKTGRHFEKAVEFLKEMTESE